jgi:hypothetical protein
MLGGVPAARARLFHLCLLFLLFLLSIRGEEQVVRQYHEGVVPVEPVVLLLPSLLPRSLLLYFPPPFLYFLPFLLPCLLPCR